MQITSTLTRDALWLFLQFEVKIAGMAEIEPTTLDISPQSGTLGHGESFGL